MGKVECSAEGNVTSAPFKKYKVHCTLDGKETVLESDMVLNGTGRAPNVLGLGLEEVWLKLTCTSEHLSQSLSG